MAEPNSNLSGDEGKKGARVWRPVVAVLATVAIVFCAWSAWQYAQGNDPLAFLSGDALQTVSEPASADDQAAATPQITMTANTVTADDVATACSGLTFDGSDVSVAADDVKAVLTANGVWVEQATTDDAPAMVDATARRAAALAKWAAEQNVGLSDVTWISEDANGAVRLVVRFGCDGAPTSGDASALLPAAEGYAISGNAYAELGDAPAFAQQGGEAPTLPDDSTITVVEKKTVDGEALTLRSPLRFRSHPQGLRMLGLVQCQGHRLRHVRELDRRPCREGTRRHERVDVLRRRFRRQYRVRQLCALRRRVHLLVVRQRRVLDRLASYAIRARAPATSSAPALLYNERH